MPTGIQRNAATGCFRWRRCCLVIVLGVAKQRDLRINTGTGREVGAGPLRDAGMPLVGRRLPGSYVDLPVSPARRWQQYGPR